MIKIYLSYFYQVRFFPQNAVPFSTAVWPPKWFRNFHVDKNGVINGLSATPLVPNHTCDGLCRGPETCASRPNTCAFLRMYRKQLDKLNFQQIVARIESISYQVQKDYQFTTSPYAVLLVFEAPQNQCSERHVLRAWARDNGYELEEWTSNASN